jgi:hypothetical protein
MNGLLSLEAFWRTNPSRRETWLVLRELCIQGVTLSVSDLATLPDIVQSIPLVAGEFKPLAYDVHLDAWRLMLSHPRWRIIMECGGYDAWRHDLQQRPGRELSLIIGNATDRMVRWMAATVSKLPVGVKRHILSFLPDNGVTPDNLRRTKDRIFRPRTSRECPICLERGDWAFTVKEFYLCESCINAKSYMYDGYYFDSDYDANGLFVEGYYDVDDGLCYYIPSNGFRHVGDILDKVQQIIEHQD